MNVIEKLDTVAEIDKSEIPATDDLVSDLIEQQSPPSEGKPVDPFTENLVDTQGRKFNAEIHRTNEAGQPILTKTGKLSVRRGRKPGSPQATLNVPKQKTAEDVAKEVECAKAGELVAELIIAAGTGIYGSEWKPAKINDTDHDERDYLRSAWSGYFVAKGWSDFPPEISVAVATGIYMLPRFGMPKTRAKTGRMFGWVRDRLMGLKNWRDKIRGRRNLQQKPPEKTDTKT